MSSESEQARVDDEAISWLIEREDGFSPAREGEFSLWLRADPRHAASLSRLEQAHDLLQKLPDYRVEINTTFGRAAPVVLFPGGEAKAAQRRGVARWPRVLIWGGVAAALAIGVFTVRRTLQPAPVIAYATTTAGYERARLDDGTTLELNEATALKVRFTVAERRVQIESGEAHFAVAHDEARPFIVSAGAVSMRAVGTAFNVRLTADAVELIVIEGKVQVGKGSADNFSAAGAAMVVAGERIQIPNEAPSPPIEKLPPSVLRESLAWQSPLADFVEAPLASVILRFNARSRTQLKLADEELAGRLVGGAFALDEAEAFVRLLERDGEIVGERHGETEIYLRRKH